MKKLPVVSLMFALLLSSCLIDRHQIINGTRSKTFLPELANNYKGHLFWSFHRNKEGKILRNNGKKVIFNKNKDTIIFVHGWQGPGMLGWTQHSLVTGPGMLGGPITAIISFFYNLPGHGATIPDTRKRAGDFNIAIFDWQQYNHTEGDFENSENLTDLERNLKKPPVLWPSIPENLAKELELFVSKMKYNHDIYLVGHSLGNEVLIRAMDYLSPEMRAKVSKIILLDPFTTAHFDYLEKNIPGKTKWLTGLSSTWITDDLNRLIRKHELNKKMVIIPSTDMGDSWNATIGEPNDITSFDNIYEEIKYNLSYARKIRKYHDQIVDDLILRKKYDGKLGW